MLIDLIPLCTLYGLMMLLVGDVSGQATAESRWNSFDALVDIINTSPERLVSPIVIGLATVFFYYLVQELVSGRTIGSRLLAITVISRKGQRPEPIIVLVRNVARLASILSVGLGYWWAAFDTERRTLHDWISGTWVIKNNSTKNSQKPR